MSSPWFQSSFNSTRTKPTQMEIFKTPTSKPPKKASNQQTLTLPGNSAATNSRSSSKQSISSNSGIISTDVDTTIFSNHPTSKSFKRSNTNVIASSSSLKRSFSDDFVDANSNVTRKQNISLSEFEPKSSQDLALSRQKLEELQKWFQVHFPKSTRSQQVAATPFLLLNGPAGTGKTASMKVLCKEFKVELIELPTTSIFKGQDLIAENLDYLSISGDIRRRLNEDHEYDSYRSIFSENQQNRFNRFLCDLNYCKKNVFTTDTNKVPYKLLLIEDIPQIFHIKPNLLHDELTILRRKFKSNTVPVVFIISDTVNGPSVENKVLPKSIQAKLNFQIISFRPVTDTCLKKAITNANATLVQKLSKTDIDEIVNASSNDIRNAFNYLIFKHSNSRLVSLNPVFTKKAKFLKGNKSSKNQDISSNGSSKALTSGREEQLTLVHAIGKILYAKRSTSADPDVLKFIDSNPHVDPLLLRNLLIEQRPEEIAERANASCDTIADWVYENYHDFISDDDLTTAIDCLEVLSLTDSHFRDFESRKAIESFRTSYLTRGEMFSLNRDASGYKEVDKFGPKKSKVSKSFKPLKGPQFRQLNKETTDNLSKLVALKDSSFYDSSIVESDKNLMLDILPCVGSIGEVQDKLRKLNLSSFSLELGEFAHTNQQSYQRLNSKAELSNEDRDFSEFYQQQYNYSSLSLTNSLATSSQPFLLANHESMPEIDDDEFDIESD